MNMEKMKEKGKKKGTITKGGELYAQTVKQTIEEATKKGTVKKFLRIGSFDDLF